MSENKPNLPQFTLQQMLEAGVHYGHKASRWNPKMAPYIFGVREETHIIDLEKTAPLFYRALEAVYTVAARGGKILFVSTKKQASDIIAEAATKCGQYYVNHRWLGGMLTNWNTVSKSISTLKNYEAQLANDELGLNKKERLQITRKLEKLNLALGGIRELGTSPDLVVIIDTNKESIAVNEANCLNIPTVAVVDSNCNPDNIDFIIPGNDDARKAIEFYCDLLSDAAVAGLANSVAQAEAEKQAQEEKLIKKKLKIEEKAEDEKKAEAPKEDVKAKEAKAETEEKKVANA